MQCALVIPTGCWVATGDGGCCILLDVIEEVE